MIYFSLKSFNYGLITAISMTHIITATEAMNGVFNVSTVYPQHTRTLPHQAATSARTHNQLFSFHDVVRTLIPPYMNENCALNVIQILKKVPAQHYAAFTQTANDLIESNLGEEDRISILNAIEKLPANKYNQTFTRTAKAFITQSMNGPNRAAVISAVGTIGAKRWNSVFFGLLNTLLTQDMGGISRAGIIATALTIPEEKYKHPGFLQMMKAFAIHENEYSTKHLISQISKISTNYYTPLFINAVKALISPYMNVTDITSIIIGLTKISPDRYTQAFINTVHALTKVRENGDNKIRIIQAIGEISSDHYNQHFTDTVNALARLNIGMFGKENILPLVTKVLPENYPFLINLISCNIQYFDFIPLNRFAEEIHKNMNHAELQRTLDNLYADYQLLNHINNTQVLHQHAFRQGVAFDIHYFSHQTVFDTSGEKGEFNNMVLNTIIKRNKNVPLLSFKAATAFMEDAMREMLEEDSKRKRMDEATHYSDKLNENTLRWAMNCQNDAHNQLVLQQVATMFQHTPEKLKTWMNTFMVESADAYSGIDNVQSCVKGVKERMITSLRNVMHDDPDFMQIFSQAENNRYLIAKLNGLSDSQFWAKKLFDAGIRSTTPEDFVKNKYEQLLNEFFNNDMNNENVNQIKEVINSLLEDFIDIESESEKENGYWSTVFKKLIQELEQNTTS